MLTVDIPAYIIKIGGFEIRYYGLVYALTVLFVIFTLRKNKEKLNLDNDKIDSLITWLVLGMIIGARIMHYLINDPSVFFTNPLRLLTIWRGGMSFFGGFLGILSSGYIWNKYNKVSYFAIADVVVLPVTLGLGLGRIANFINQELVGTVTDVSWCFNFVNASGCRHPYQLYASISHFVLFFMLLYLIKDIHNRKEGSVLFSFIIGYSVLRFLVDFFREDIRFFGLTSWQYMSILFFSVGIYLFFKFRKDSSHQNQEN